MQLTGFVRKLDSLGRITLPAEVRKKLFVDKGDAMEIFLDDDDRIVLRKYKPSDCDTFTGEFEDLIDFQGKKVSKKNIRTLARLAGFDIAD